MKISCGDFAISERLKEKKQAWQILSNFTTVTKVQNMEFSIENFSSKCDQIDTFTEEINEKIHF